MAADAPPETLLVTGAAGFIGSSVSLRLLAGGRRVVGLDDLDDYYDPAIKRANVADLGAHAGFTFVAGDIRDAALVARLLAEHGVDAVLHLAARAGVRPSIADPALYADVNVRGTTVLLEAARRAGVSTFVQASSSSVYGSRDDPPFREDDPPAPAISPYAASKQCAEAMGRCYATLHGMDVTSLRFFNAYGPRQRPDLAIHKFTRLMRAGRPLPFYGDGSMRRDHTFIDDIVDGVVRAVDRCAGSGHRVYNLGNSATVSLTALVAALERCWDVEAVLERLPDQPGDVPMTCADLTRSRRELGFEPTTDLADGLERFKTWFLRQESRTVS